MSGASFKNQAVIYINSRCGGSRGVRFLTSMTRKGNLIWHTRVDETQIRSAGVAGVIRPSETAVQVVVGTKVQSIADELRKLLQ